LNGHSRSYFIPTGTQQDFALFYKALASDFGTRVPHVFSDPVEHPEPTIPWRPLLTENVHPQILVGYGDPAVLKSDDDYWLVAPLITGKPLNTTGLGLDPAAPQMSGGVIDPHIFVDPGGDAYLFWKDDTNSIWPRPLAMLLRQHPELIEPLFENEADRRTASF